MAPLVLIGTSCQSFAEIFKRTKRASHEVKPLAVGGDWPEEEKSMPRFVKDWRRVVLGLIARKKA